MQRAREIPGYAQSKPSSSDTLRQEGNSGQRRGTGVCSKEALRLGRYFSLADVRASWRRDRLCDLIEKRRRSSVKTSDLTIMLRPKCSLLVTAPSRHAYCNLSIAMFVLKAHLELFGLKAPVFSWVVSVCLIAYCIFVYVRHYKASRNRQHLLGLAETRLRSLEDKETPGPGQGISRHMYDSIAAVFDDLPLLQASWCAISSCIVVTDRAGEERLWVSDDMGHIMRGANVVDSQSYKTAPTVISGVGLLATFLAILVALLDVKLTQNRVQGLDLLVQGLSGKFLSSVVAVACATILIYAEKGLSRPILTGTESLVTTLRGLLPRLVPAQILSDLRTEIATQSRMFGRFNVDLARNVKDGLTESVRPVMEGMVSAVDDLNRFMREDGARKQASMNDQFAVQLKSFGESLEMSLDRMASRFNVSLAGSTGGQFAGISESLSNTVALLQQTNHQLSGNQGVFGDLINLAKGTTAEELEGRRAQIDHLTGVVDGLMERLQEKTGESMGSMEKAFAAITVNISDKVMDLSRQMAAMVEETSEKSTSKVREVIDQAGSLNSRSALHLTQLLERHSAELTKVEDLRTLLDVTIKGFIASIDTYGRVTEGLQKVASQANMGVVSLSQIAKSTKESQEAAARVSLSVSGQVESMRGFAQDQKEVWDRIQASMVQYETVFGRVEEHAGDLLDQIANHLKDYSDTTEKHFSNLTVTADNLIAQATGRLSVSIEELVEQLDELQAAASVMARVSRGVA
jgi:hypothetical protein